MAKEVIKNTKDNTVRLIHYHASGCSFSSEDFASFACNPSIFEIRVTTADGWTYIVTKTPGSLIGNFDQVVHECENVDSQLNFKLMSAFRGRKITMAEKRMIASRGISKVLARKYNWEYKEIKQDSR